MHWLVILFSIDMLCLVVIEDIVMYNYIVYTFLSIALFNLSYVCCVIILLCLYTDVTSTTSPCASLVLVFLLAEITKCFDGGGGGGGLVAGGAPAPWPGLLRRLWHSAVRRCPWDGALMPLCLLGSAPVLGCTRASAGRHGGATPVSTPSAWSSTASSSLCGTAAWYPAATAVGLALLWLQPLLWLFSYSCCLHAIPFIPSCCDLGHKQGGTVGRRGASVALLAGFPCLRVWWTSVKHLLPPPSSPFHVAADASSTEEQQRRCGGVVNTDRRSLQAVCRVDGSRTDPCGFAASPRSRSFPGVHKLRQAAADPVRPRPTPLELSLSAAASGSKGTLRRFDQATNIILDESHERVYSTKRGRGQEEDFSCERYVLRVQV